MRERTRAIVLAMLMVVSVVAPFAGAAAAAPDGMVGVPESNIAADIPAHAQDRIPAHAGVWDVHSSAHADALDVRITTRSRASDERVAVPANADDADALVLELTDDQNHEGRQVAIDAATLVEAVGHQPEMAYGFHEDGTRWEAPITYEDGVASFEVPHFSTNTVTFAGEVVLTGSPAENGTTYQYDLSDGDAPDNFTVELTGSTHKVQDSVAGDGVADGESVAYDIGGTTAPESVTLTLTGDTYTPGAYWTAPTADENRELIADGTNVYVGGHDHSVEAYAQDSGTETWSTTVYGRPVGDLADDGSTVYSVDSWGDVTALSKTDGSESWSTNLGSSARGVSHADTSVNDLFVIVDSSVYNLDKTDGTTTWEFTNPTDNLYALDEVASGSNVYAGGYDQTLYAVAKSDGTETWSTAVGANIRSVVTNGSTVIIGTGDGTVAAYDTADGSQQWSTQPGTSTVRSVTLENGAVYAGGDDGEVWRLDADTGTVAWTYAVGGTVNELAADSEAVYVAGGDNAVHAVAPDLGERMWRFSDPTGGVESIATNATHVFAGSADNTIYTLEKPTPSTDPAVAIDGTTELSYAGELAYGETTSTSLSLGTGANTLDVSTSSGTVVDVDMEYTEVTESVDPAVTVNGDTYQHTGTLADGETTALDVSEASLQSGTNTVEVVVAESYGGPIGQVGLDYSHDAIDNQTVEFEAEAWSERYNVSKTFAGDRAGASLTVPFASDRVIAIRDLEKRVNGTTWETVAAADYTLDGTELTVDLGNVDAGTTVEVRTTATKVKVSNGEIDVTEPTVLSDDLNSEIEIVSHSDGFKIAVGGTANGSELHYTHGESYKAGSYALITADGTQELYLPNAGAGETARVSTIPLEPEPASGEVELVVESAGAEPEFRVRRATTNDIKLVWTDTTSGNTYQLYSQTQDKEIDRATASSPVTLYHDGTEETLAIFDLGSGSGGGAGGAIVASADPSGLLGLSQGERLILVVAIALAGLFMVSRRTGDDSVSGRTVLLLGAGLAGVLGFTALSPEIGSFLGRALQENLPLILLLVAGAGYLWYRQARQPEQVNVIDFGRLRR